MFIYGFPVFLSFCLAIAIYTKTKFSLKFVENLVKMKIVSSVKFAFKTQLTFSDAETHAKRSKNQTEDGDEDREGGPEAEAGEDVRETAALGRQCAQTVQGDELVDARRRSSVVVRSYLYSIIINIF